jgi:hypothetical protein
VSGEARARPLFPQVLAQNPSCTGAEDSMTPERCGCWSTVDGGRR